MDGAPETTVLQTQATMRRRWFSRIFAFIYTLAFLSLLHHHFQNLTFITPARRPTILISPLMLLADLVFAFMAITYQGFLVNPIHRETFPENLPRVFKGSGTDQYPAMDVFVCTADPYKEPPLVVVNTALSVMAYDYPTEKLSVYLSDDGGSQLTLFAFMEAAKFARYWLPYCKKNDIVDRCPGVYFGSNPKWFPEFDDIKARYNDMKIRITNVVEWGE